MSASPSPEEAVPEQRDPSLQRLTDRSEIHDVLARYARAVDRGLWDDLWLVYHADAYDDHVEYRGDIPGLIVWLKDRFSGVEGSTHFLGNCLIEFAGRDRALVETYFVSTRLAGPADDTNADAGDALCRQSRGRYLDRFERRDAGWRIAHRQVVLDSRFTFLARGGMRDGSGVWGQRDASDPLHRALESIRERHGDSDI
jgi:hypothetical protein